MIQETLDNLRVMEALSGSKGQLHLPVLNSWSSPVQMQGKKKAVTAHGRHKSDSPGYGFPQHGNFSSRSLQSSFCGGKLREGTATPVVSLRFPKDYKIPKTVLERRARSSGNEAPMPHWRAVSLSHFHFLQLFVFEQAIDCIWCISQGQSL